MIIRKWHLCLICYAFPVTMPALQAQSEMAPPLADKPPPEPEPGFLQLKDVSFHMGHSLGKESSSWAATRSEAISEEILRQNSPNAANTAVPVANKDSGNIFFRFEGMLAVNFKKMPGLGSVESLRNLRGIRVGLNLLVAPFDQRITQTVAGPFSYVDPTAILTTRTYSGNIRVEEKLLRVTPGISLSYFYERGFFKQLLVPYAFFEIGMGIATGSRVYSLFSEPANLGQNTQAAGTYQLTARIHESFENALGLRLAPGVGAQIHIQGGHYIDIRGGFQMEQYQVTLNRVGSFTESQSNTAGQTVLTYSQTIIKDTKSATLSQTGIYFMLGYTACLR